MKHIEVVKTKVAVIRKDLDATSSLASKLKLKHGV
jgi:hypothetical protein